jgi:hypothetical protein
MLGLETQTLDSWVDLKKLTNSIAIDREERHDF